MPVLKIAAAVLLVLLLGGVGWILTHLRRIKRELLANNAMPRPGPGSNLLFLLVIVFIALSGLMIAFLFY